MKLKYKTNFSGYFPILRGIQLLLKNKSLNFTQLGAYICFIAQVDFDRRHENYRAIIRDDSELAKQWGCDAATVYRRRKELIKKGLLVEENGITKVPNFHIFELEWVKTFAKFPPEVLQSLFTKSQDEIANEKITLAEMQKKQLQNNRQSSNITSKGELSFSDKLEKDNTLSSEEIEWIDENVVEDIDVDDRKDDN